MKPRFPSVWLLNIAHFLLLSIITVIIPHIEKEICYNTRVLNANKIFIIVIAFHEPWKYSFNILLYYKHGKCVANIVDNVNLTFHDGYGKIEIAWKLFWLNTSIYQRNRPIKVLFEKMIFYEYTLLFSTLSILCTIYRSTSSLLLSGTPRNDIPNTRERYFCTAV